jgi:hypothetical protein
MQLAPGDSVEVVAVPMKVSAAVVDPGRRPSTCGRGFQGAAHS